GVEVERAVHALDQEVAEVQLRRPLDGHDPGGVDRRGCAAGVPQHQEQAILADDGRVGPRHPGVDAGDVPEQVADAVDVVDVGVVDHQLRQVCQVRLLIVDRAGAADHAGRSQQPQRV